VLDAPCGHGRIANLLAPLGIAVTGIDSSPVFLERARLDADAVGVQVTYQQGDITALPEDVAEFDAVISWFTSFGYFDDDLNRKVLAEYRRVLRGGGLLLIETIHRDWIVRHFTPAPFGSVTTIGDDLMIDQNSFDPLTGRLHAVRTIVRDGRVQRSNHFVRLIAPPEFHDWLTTAGFREIEFRTRDGAPLTLDTRRLVVLATAD
jgi:SAM-dependent methyltransferase